MNADLNLQLTAVFEPAEEGGYTCWFEELPGVFSEEESLEEVKANLHDALQLVLAYHRDQAREAGTASTVRETYDLFASA